MRRLGEVMAVLAAVDLVEGLERLGERGLVDRAVGERHAQLVALADIAQVAAALEGHLGEVDAVGGEAVGQLPGHGGEVRVDAREVGRARDLERGADRVVAAGR